MDIKLLGDFSIAYDGEPITRAHAPRLQALLAYLILHRAAPQSRQHLAFLFWPDSSEGQARTNLRREFHALRQVLPEADRYLLTDAAVIQWRRDAPQTIDVCDFGDAIAAAREASRTEESELLRSSLERALLAYQGDLLPSCYDEWIESERERLRLDYGWALERLADLNEESRSYAEAARLVERLLVLDPTRDAVIRQLMRLYLLHGDRAAALQAYHGAAERLRRELGVDPDAETRALYERVRRAEEREARPIPIEPSSLFVGRRRERQDLLTAWRLAAEGRSHLVLIEGEAGIGKSRLAEELRTWVSRQGIATAAARSYAAEGEHIYGPIIEWLRSEPLRLARGSLNDTWLAELSRLIPELLMQRPDLRRLSSESAGSERPLAEALVQAVKAVDGPLLLILDDLQWTDPQTIGWLRFLLLREPGLRLLIVGTVRRDEIGEGHPLASLTRDLGRSDQITRIELGPLDDAESRELARAVAGRSLSSDLAVSIFRESEGNPLFIVEMVRAGSVVVPERESGRVDQRGDRGLPPKVTAVIAERLAQLSPPARELAALAATIGRGFNLDVLLAASGEAEEAVVAALDELCSRDIVRDRGAAVFDFSHDKLREVAYAEINSARCQLYHRRVARALETVQAHDLGPVSAQLAAHFKLGGLPEEAVRFYEVASERSLQLSAYQDAITQIQHGLELLSSLPATQARAQQEARLYTALGVALMATRGWPTSEAGAAYRHAQLLYESAGDAGEYSRLIWGLWAFHVVRGELDTARRLAEQTLALAAGLDDRGLRLLGELHLGGALFHQGELAQARTYLERAVAHYDPEQHHAHASQFGPDLGIFSGSYLSHALWHLGFPDEAARWSLDSLSLARERAHPYSLALALSYAAMLAEFLGDDDAVRQYAAEALDICHKHDFAYYLNWCAILLARVTLKSEPSRQAAAIELALSNLRASGAGVRLPYYYALLAEAHLAGGALESANQALAAAWSSLRQNGERNWEPELNRIQAAIMMARGASASAVASRLREGLAVAQRQGALSLELRAAMSLGRQLFERGQRSEARDLLVDVRQRLADGLGTRDLKGADALLREFRP